MGFDGLTERNRQAHGAPAIALAAPFAGNPPTGGLFAGAAMEQSDGFNVAGKNGSLMKGDMYSEFEDFGVATGLFVGGSAAVTCLTVSDLANGRNSSWGAYAAKTLAGAVTGAVMRNFGGALGSLWPASGTLARAGLAGATYGMMFRKNDQFFGEVFGLEGYRERDFWEKVWYVFSPARAARDGGLAALLQSVAGDPMGSPEPEAQAGANELVPAEAGPESAPEGLDAGAGESALPGTDEGNLTGSLDKLTQAEKTMVNDLLKQGKNVEIIPCSNLQNIQTPDFKVNGVLTELKTLNGTSLNTPVTRITDGFKQGASTVIIDARTTGLTIEQANTVLNRLNGIYNNNIPGKIEIWTNFGTISGGKQKWPEWIANAEKHYQTQWHPMTYNSEFIPTKNGIKF